MTTPRQILFAHGLEGSPNGNKATALREAFGAHSPWLGELNVDGQVALLKALLLEREASVLIGSSLGAIAALGASLEVPEKISHLILLAPAVGGHKREDLFAEAERVRPGLAAQVERLSRASIPPSVPATIIHGFEDEILETPDVVALARRSPSARLILLHADHSLHSVHDLILKVAGRVSEGRDPLTGEVAAISAR